MDSRQARSPDMAPRSATVSASWRPIFIMGWSAEWGFWNTIDIELPLTPRIARSLRVKRVPAAMAHAAGQDAAGAPRSGA